MSEMAGTTAVCASEYASAASNRTGRKPAEVLYPESVEVRTDCPDNSGGSTGWDTIYINPRPQARSEGMSEGVRIELHRGRDRVTVDLGCVLPGHPPHIVIRQTADLLGDHLLRVRPRRVAVR